jgi:hypothetical protein
VTPFELIDWPCPAPDGERYEEMALVFDRGRERRLLVLPAWFDEANKLRRQTVEVMRRLDLSGIDCFLPDLPGTNESEAATERQTIDSWRLAAAAAAQHFRATHLLTIRAGTLIAPPGLPGWAYAPIDGPRVLRAMLRARALASREAGVKERAEEVQASARQQGIDLAGWRLGPGLFGALERPIVQTSLAPIEQAALGGAGLWLRAEPDEDPEQADALAALLVVGMTAP